MPALHGAVGASGRQPLAAPRAAALEDRAAGARRHPGAEAVLALPAAHVGLVGPLHVRGERRRGRAPGSRARASIDEHLERLSVFHSRACCAGSKKRCERALRGPTAPSPADVSTPVENGVEREKSLQIGHFLHDCGVALSARSATLLCSPLSPPARSWSARRGAPAELTAETSVDRGLRSAPGALNDTTFGTWFGDVEGRELTDDAFVLAVPNDFTREWIEGHFLDLIGAAVRDATGRERRIQLIGRAATPSPAAARAEPPRAAGAGRAGHEPEVHVRLVRDRLVEPLRARGGARRRRGAGAGVQPALHLRRHRARQDAPAAGDRPVRRRALAASSPSATSRARRS